LNAQKKKKKLSLPKKGEELLEHFIQLTGIPPQSLLKELGDIFEKKGIDPKKITIEQLRLVVASYLRDFFAQHIPKLNRKTEEEH